MIKEFAIAWEKNKNALENYLREHEQEKYNSYKALVEKLFELVINPYTSCNRREVYPYLMKFNTDDITEIDNGNWQGTLIYLIPLSTYQPTYNEYVVTYVYYGSCSGCDTLLGVSCYEDGKPNNNQVKEYMQLCLHILQHAKWLYDDGEEK